MDRCRAWVGIAVVASCIACHEEGTPREPKRPPAAAPARAADSPKSEPAARPEPAPEPEPTAEPAQPIEPVKSIAVAPEPPAPAPSQLAPEPEDIYTGAHKLGVNRVTDMARIGTVRFSQRDGALYLQGRVERGKHWLELSGKVVPDGPKKFDLIGTIRGVPDMAWAGEAARERTTEGRFTFYVRKGRPYFRMYEVNGRECVCDDDCGNDFCYIDIEQRP